MDVSNRAGVRASTQPISRDVWRWLPVLTCSGDTARAALLVCRSRRRQGCYAPIESALCAAQSSNLPPRVGAPRRAFFVLRFTKRACTPSNGGLLPSSARAAQLAPSSDPSACSFHAGSWILTGLTRRVGRVRATGGRGSRSSTVSTRES
jgi:hypothetical protein